MNCIDYYKDKCGIDISVLPWEEGNYITTCYLESIYYTKEELEEIIKEHFDSIEKSEKIEGGLADNKTIENIAKHHGLDVEKIQSEFEVGIKVEMEHTDDKSIAGEIAKDHLWEIPDYYTRLAEMEKEAKGDELEKGKVAQIGEIREWSGIKMKKTANGWIPAGEKKEKNNEEDLKDKDSNPKEEEGKQHSLEQLAEFARKTSENDLKQAAIGENEQLRIVAKQELDRRNTEENFNQEQKREEKSEDFGEKDKNFSTQTTKEILAEKLKTLVSEYKDITSKAMNDDLSDINNSKRLNEKQREYARYIRRINDFLNYDTKEQLSNFSKALGVSEKEIKDMFGDGEILGFVFRASSDFGKGKGSADINILTKDMCCSRLLNFDEKKVTNEEFLLDVDLEKGKGRGADIFINQVEQFRKFGFETMETIACRTEGSHNGYYTWARLGYYISQPSISFDAFEDMLNEAENKKIKNCNSLHELMSFKEGRDFWKENGFTFKGVFDLKENSDSMKILKAYESSKK